MSFSRLFLPNATLNVPYFSYFCYLLFLTLKLGRGRCCLGAGDHRKDGLLLLETFLGVFYLENLLFMPEKFWIAQNLTLLGPNLAHFGPNLAWNVVFRPFLQNAAMNVPNFCYRVWRVESVDMEVSIWTSPFRTMQHSLFSSLSALASLLRSTLWSYFVIPPGCSAEL